MAGFVIDVYSHHFRVMGYNQRGLHVLKHFYDRLGKKEWEKDRNGNWMVKISKYFAGKTSDDSEFRFHRNILQDFLKFLRNSGVPESNINVEYLPVKDGVDVDFKVNPDFTPRENQPIVIEYMSAPKPTKITVLQTGKGKSFCGSVAIANIGKRTAIVVRAMYVDKWCDDVKLYLGLGPKDVMVVRGSRDLQVLIDLALAGVYDSKIIIFSNMTIYNFIKEYEATWGTPAYPYKIAPYELYELLGVHVRLIDEVHLDFHLNFRQDLYAHVPQTMDLSATITPDDPFLSRMYLVKYPKDIRLEGIEYDRYIKVTALMYMNRSGKRVRYLRRGRQSYSHVDFEKSLMKDKVLWENYLSLIEDVVARKFISVYKPGMRCLVFAALVETCDIITKRLSKRFPHLLTRTYYEKSSKSELNENDISVSTYQSAGTAVDIPNLRTTISTTAMSTRQGNEQMLGRTRRLKDYPDETPEFVYFVCTDIPKHMSYHRKKKEDFAGKVLSHDEEYSQRGI